MNNENRITLKTMAQRLNRCPKTFRKYVVKYRIPHICLGRDMLFNASEVEKYLADLTLANQISAQKCLAFTTSKSKAQNNSKQQNKSNDRYASLLRIG